MPVSLTYVRWRFFKHHLTAVNASHVNSRCAATRRAIYRLAPAGMSYPGLCSWAKAYLWKTVGIPCLTYGMSCISLSPGNLKQLETAQGTTVKSCLGLGKRHRHSRLLQALNIPTVTESVVQDVASLMNRVSRVKSPARSVFFHLLSDYIITGKPIPGTLADRIIRNHLPLDLLARQDTFSVHNLSVPLTPDGVTDSLRYLVGHDKYNRQGSFEHRLVRLLTSAF